MVGISTIRSTFLTPLGPGDFPFASGHISFETHSDISIASWILATFDLLSQQNRDVKKTAAGSNCLILRGLHTVLLSSHLRRDISVCFLSQFLMFNMSNTYPVSNVVVALVDYFLTSNFLVFLFFSLLYFAIKKASPMNGGAYSPP